MLHILFLQIVYINIKQKKILKTKYCNINKYTQFRGENIKKK